VTARPGADSEVVVEDDDRVWGWNLQRSLQSPFWEVWGWSPLVQLNTFTYLRQRCDEVRIQIWQRSNFECFQRIRNLTNVLSALLLNVNSWKNPCSVTDLIIYTESQSERRQTCYFSNSTHHTNYSYCVCNI